MDRPAADVWWMGVAVLPGFVYWPTGTIDEDLLYRRSRITDTYVRGESLQAPAIALIVQGPQLEGIGLLDRGEPVTSFHRRILITNIEITSDQPDLSALATMVPARVRGHLRDVFRRGGPIPPASWEHLRAALAMFPSVWRTIERLERKAAPPPWTLSATGRARQVVAQERDAVGLALSFGRLDRDALDQWTPPDEPAPFLSGIDHLELREDQLLIHDMLVFGDWQRESVNGLWAQFSDSRGRRVHVMNVNRHPLETTLGADLIYYNHEHDAFTILQYKRMRWEDKSTGLGREPIYRPAHDKNLGKQILRMRAVEPDDSPPPSVMSEYRLGRAACYLKICHPDLELSGRDLGRGMYLDLDLWDLALGHLAPTGGNPAVTYGDTIRYLNNTEFIALVQGGWIGSRSVTSRRIETYISRALRNRHSVTLAVSEE